MACHPDRAYWELQAYVAYEPEELSYFLEERGVTVKKSEKAPKGRTPVHNKAELITRLECLDRGVPHYPSFTKEELLGFVKARKLNRGLKPTFRALTTHHGLATLLMNRDKKPSFDRFMRLVPELREVVYEQYIDTLPRQPDTLTPPPLAEVSKDVRADFLKLFYRRSDFQLAFLQGMDEQNNVLSANLVPSPRVGQFLGRLTADIATRMRAITLNHITELTHPDGSEFITYVMVTILARDGDYEVETEFMRGGCECQEVCEHGGETFAGAAEYRSVLDQGGNIGAKGKGFRVTDIRDVARFVGTQRLW